MGKFRISGTAMFALVIGFTVLFGLSVAHFYPDPNVQGIGAIVGVTAFVVGGILGAVLLYERNRKQRLE